MNGHEHHHHGPSVKAPVPQAQTALKKHLSRIGVQPNDIVVYRIAPGEKPPPQSFLHHVAEALTEHGAAALVVMREGESIASVDAHRLAHAGLVRAFNPSKSYTSDELDAMEAESIANLRLAFAALRDRLGEGNNGGSRITRDTPEDTDQR